MKHEFPDAETASDPSWTQPLDEVAAMVDQQRRLAPTAQREGGHHGHLHVV